MPVASGYKERIGALPGEISFDLLAGFLIDFLFFFLANAVEALELSGAVVCFDDLARLKELECNIGISDSSGGVDARSHSEGDVGGRQFAAELGAFNQRSDSGAELFSQGFDTEFHHDAVLSEQRNDVCNGSEGDIVQHLFKSGVEASEILLSAVFDKGMRELEGGAGSGEQLQILEFGIYFSVDDRESFGKFRPGLVVVGDDHVDTAFDSLIDRFAAGDTAVDRDQDSAGAERLESLVERLGGKSVAVIKAVGNKGVYRRTILT